MLSFPFARAAATHACRHFRSWNNFIWIPAAGTKNRPQPFHVAGKDLFSALAEARTRSCAWPASYFSTRSGPWIFYIVVATQWLSTFFCYAAGGRASSSLMSSNASFPLIVLMICSWKDRTLLLHWSWQADENLLLAARPTRKHTTKGPAAFETNYHRVEIMKILTSQLVNHRALGEMHSCRGLNRV